MDNLVVDSCGSPPAAPDGTVVGRRIPPVMRMVWASFSGRYQPSHPPDENCFFGMDFSFVLPPGVQIVSAGLVILTNTFVPTAAPEWAVGPLTIEGAVVYARLAGGVEGVDYQLRWTAFDSDGNVWQRTALVLCSLTS